jgi:hypothetical protein
VGGAGTGEVAQPPWAGGGDSIQFDPELARFRYHDRWFVESNTELIGGRNFDRGRQQRLLQPDRIGLAGRRGCRWSRLRSGHHGLRSGLWLRRGPRLVHRLMLHRGLIRHLARECPRRQERIEAQRTARHGATRGGSPGPGATRNQDEPQGHAKGRGHRRYPGPQCDSTHKSRFHARGHGQVPSRPVGHFIPFPPVV